VAFCPHPPLLVPEVAQGAAHELAELRSACRTAIRRVASPGSPLLAIGAGAGWQPHPPTARGSLAAYGVPLELPLGSDESGPVELPLSLTIGAWLLRDALGPSCGASAWSVGSTERVERLEPDDDMPRVLLVMGDGSARRSTTAPGYLDDRAAGYDASVALALATGEPAGLRTDVALADELLAAGARTWNAAGRELAGSRWDADLLYDAAPYGVGYFVAVWTRRD
jgi:hypothetical protein